MHREYHPEDMHHLRAHAFGAGGHDHDHHPHDHGHDDHHEGHGHDHRSLYGFTALLGVLIGLDVVLGWAGRPEWSAPLGVSFATIAAVLGGGRIVYGALEALLGGRIGADFALAQACIAALMIGQPFVAAEVVFIAMVGEVLEAITFDRAQRAILRLLDQAPRLARVRRDGVEREIPAHQVEVGDLVLVGPGEKVPVDGTVIEGRSAVDQAALTGESLPVDKGAGDAVHAGTINQLGRLEVRAEKVGHETTLGQVFRMVAEAQRRKSPLERTADRLARWFLPVVQVVAGLTLLAGYTLGWPDVWSRAVAVLVVACPCALVLATPAAVLASMAWLARHGVLIKGGAALERLAGCDTFAFDKTGTLTRGRPEWAGAVPLAGWDEDRLLEAAATAERGGNHPLAAVVRAEADRRGLRPYDGYEAEALLGTGVRARRPDGSATILVGNRRLMAEHGIEPGDEAARALEAIDARGETALLVAVDGAVVGLLAARDQVRREAHDAVHDLKHLKIGEVALLTGDRAPAARLVAKKTHIKVVEAELLPADKARWVEERQSAGRRVAMVGDGINDAPALAKAHVGIALAGIGSDLAAEAGDILLMGEPLAVLPDLVRLSRATVAVIRQNIVVFAFGLNAAAMGSAALGWLGPVPAAILHQAGSLLVLLNAMRLLLFGRWSETPPARWLAASRRELARIDDRLDPAPLLAAVAARRRSLATAAVVLPAAAYATLGWSAIGPDEVGLLRRFGRFERVLGPGLHLRWPPPFETVSRLQPDRVRAVEVGFRSIGAGPDGSEAVRWETTHATAARAEDEALVLTGDGRYAEITATAHFRLDRRPQALRAHAFGVVDAAGALGPLAESAIRSIAGRRTLDALMTGDRTAAEREAAALLQARADDCGLGVVVDRLDFQDVHPPRAVVDAYRDVSRAESDLRRRENEGRAYRADRVGTADGLAAATLARAEADREGRVALAEGRAYAFLARLDARAEAPGLTDLRAYWEQLAAALAGRPKLVLDPERARRHLLLAEPPSVPAAALAPATATTP